MKTVPLGELGSVLVAGKPAVPHFARCHARLRRRPVAVVSITDFVDTSRPHNTKDHIRLGERHSAEGDQGPSAMPKGCVVHRGYQQEQKVLERFLGFLFRDHTVNVRFSGWTRLIILRTFEHHEPHW